MRYLAPLLACLALACLDEVQGSAEPEPGEPFCGICGGTLPDYGLRLVACPGDVVDDYCLHLNCAVECLPEDHVCTRAARCN